MAEEEKSELEVLKARANTMGIKYSPNIGLETLRTKIENALNETKETKDEEKRETVQSLNAKRNKLRKEALKLIRIRVTDLDPKKKDLPGEILCVANKYIGSVKRYVPYNGEPWHVEQCILNMMKDREFLMIRSVKGKNGSIDQEKKWVKEYAIEELPPLTREELNKLAAAQAAAGSVK